MKNTKQIYLNNKDLLVEIKNSKKAGMMTDKLALMLQTLTRRYAKKGNFANYSYNDDMQGYAMLMLCKTWTSFDENKSNNPFAFFTQCIKNSFIQYLNQERRARDIKNKTLIESGLSPSFSYILDYEENFHEKREAIINGTYDEFVKMSAFEFQEDDILIENDVDEQIENVEEKNLNTNEQDVV